MIIIILKKPIYNLFQLKKKAKCSCEEIEKKKQMA